MSEHDTEIPPVLAPGGPADPRDPAAAAWRAIGGLEEVAHAIAHRAQEAAAAAEEAAQAAQACARAVDEMRLSGTRPRQHSVTSEVRQVADQAVQNIKAEAQSIKAEALVLETIAPDLQKLTSEQPQFRRENRRLSVYMILLLLVDILARAYFASGGHH